jgi:hypothetical protein
MLCLAAGLVLALPRGWEMGSQTELFHAPKLRPWTANGQDKIETQTP